MWDKLKGDQDGMHNDEMNVVVGKEEEMAFGRLKENWAFISRTNSNDEQDHLCDMFRNRN